MRCSRAPPARAAGLEIGMEDERLLLGHPDAAGEAVAEWKALGVDVVRIHAQWWNIAPKRKPPAFRASDPADPRYNWAALDLAVSTRAARG